MRYRLTPIEIGILLCAALLVVTIAVSLRPASQRCDHTHGTCEQGWDR